MFELAPIGFYFLKQKCPKTVKIDRERLKHFEHEKIERERERERGNLKKKQFDQFKVFQTNFFLFSLFYFRFTRQQQQRNKERKVYKNDSENKSNFSSYE